MYDIVIVGGGIAGMTAAIYGLRAGKLLCRPMWRIIRGLPA